MRKRFLLSVVTKQIRISHQLITLERSIVQACSNKVLDRIMRSPSRVSQDRNDQGQTYVLSRPDVYRRLVYETGGRSIDWVNELCASHQQITRLLCLPYLDYNCRGKFESCVSPGLGKLITYISLAIGMLMFLSINRFSLIGQQVQ